MRTRSRTAVLRLIPTMLSAMSLAAAIPAAADQGTPPEIELEASSVIVHGVPRGHSAVLFGFAQDVQHFVITLRRWEQILEHGDSNDLTFALDRPVPQTSIWLAVDLTTGLVGVAAPEGMPLRELLPSSGNPAETEMALISSSAWPSWCWCGRVRTVLGLAAVAAIVVRPGYAYEYPSVEHGVKPERAFFVGDIDQVRLFNGGLSVSIPIGQRFQVGPELDYGFTLTYDSQIWDYVGAVVGPSTVTQAWPVRGANAGFGWRLSLGEYSGEKTFGPGSCTRESSMQSGS